MAQPSQWRCRVCGQPGKRTREHVFGKWLAELFGITKRTMTLSSTRGGKLWSARGLQTVVDVCAVCNNGWMSDLEGQFQATFSRAILGHPDRFGPSELTTLAHWASKTAIMLQPHLAGHGEVSHEPTGHMAALPLGVPAGTRVWLGAYTPVTRYVFWQNVPMTLEHRLEERGSGWTGYILLMTVGHLMIAVLALDSEWGSDLAVTGLPDGVFRPVWPLPNKRLEWPHQGGLILNDLGIATFWPPGEGQLRVTGAIFPPGHESPPAKREDNGGSPSPSPSDSVSPEPPESE